MALRILLCLITVSASAPWRPHHIQAVSKPSVVAVENGGLLFTDNAAGVCGTDAGYSIPIGKRTLWLFGDVFLLDPRSPEKPYRGDLSNCGLLVPSGRGAAPLRSHRFLTDSSTGLARTLIPPDAGDGKAVRYWPFGGWFDSGSKKVYLFYARIRVTGSGPLDFKTEGFGLSASPTVNPAKLSFQRIRNASGKQLWWPEADGVSFGSAVVAGGKAGSLYVAGFRRRSGRTEGLLARVRSDRIEDSAAYEYFAGGDPPRWSGAPADSAAIPGLTDFPTEMSISYNRYLGGYLAAHSVWMTDRIRLSLAREPWGPYELIGEVGSPKRAFSKGFTYAGKEHPELSERGGQIVYLTYVDSERYWLQLLKATLSR